MVNIMYLLLLCVENNVCDQFDYQFKKIIQAFLPENAGVVSTQGSQALQLPDGIFDYIFIDPPFGANIMYSELSFIREVWLKVFTNNSFEVIENTL